MDSVACVALDIHKMFSKAVAMGADEGILLEEKVSHVGHEHMRRFLSQFDGGTDVLMEATFNWPWITDLAEEIGLAPHLGDPAELRKSAKGKGKSDRKDAIHQGEQWLRRNYPEVYLAPPEVRSMRSLFRTRLLIVQLRTGVKNSVHGVLFKRGILIDEVSDIFSDKGRWILKKLDLDDASLAELAVKLAVIDDMDLHVKKLEKKIRLELTEDPRAVLIMTIPGVGVITAYAILAEIGEIERFPNGRALAAYGGHLPLDNESAGKDFGKRTGFHCNHFLRWAAIEAVTGAVRKSPRMRSLNSRVKARNRSAPGKARVAVAREILELVHLVLTRKVPYTETPPPRQGSEKAKERDAGRRARRSRRTKAKVSR